MPDDKSLEARVQGLEDEIENNRVAIARLETENRFLRDERDRAVKLLEGDAEVRKVAALADVTDRTEQRKHSREVAIKLVAASTALLGIVSAALSKC